MSKEFEIVYEFEVDATPGEVWDAITSGTGGWLWPMEFDGEKRVGPFGSTLTNFDPPHRLTALSEDVGFPTQSLNQIDETIEPRDDGRRAWVRYVHSGIFTDDWDNQYDGASKHNAFYLHTLREYVTHFAGRPVGRSPSRHSTAPMPQLPLTRWKLRPGRSVSRTAPPRGRGCGRAGPRANSWTPYSTSAVRTSSGCAPKVR